MNKKIGIMGGTFDPIHYGHLLIASNALEEFALEEVIFIPTGVSPHKDCNQVTDGERRCIMVQKAIAENRQFQLSKMELQNQHTSYTYETLERLNERYKEAELFFIMGEDSLHDFSSWYRPERICELATLLVAVRSDDRNMDITKAMTAIQEKYQARIYQISSPNYSVSSKDIRKRVEEGRSIHYLVPPSVEAYIHRENLYLVQKK